MPAGEPSIPNEPTSPTAIGRFFIAYTEEGLSPTPTKPEETFPVVVGVVPSTTDDAYGEYEGGPPKGPPNANAAFAAAHANAECKKNAAMTFRTRRHIADAEAKRCAGRADARVYNLYSASSDDGDVVSS